MGCFEPRPILRRRRQKRSPSLAVAAQVLADGELSYDGAKADVWAAGVVAFELVAGKRPFSGPTPEALARAASAEAAARDSREADALRKEVR